MREEGLGVTLTVNEAYCNLTLSTSMANSTEDLEFNQFFQALQVPANQLRLTSYSKDCFSRFSQDSPASMTMPSRIAG